MPEKELIPYLFRTEFRKITAVLCKLFGIEHVEAAEDLVSDTFMQAAETWGLKGIPENPAAWLYAAAKNKAINYVKRNSLFEGKVTGAVIQSTPEYYVPEIDLSVKNISDSQLQMMFAVCHPSIPPEAQIGLALRILCGFGIEEIADAFLSNKETINKRLFRAKEKLRAEKVKIELPPPAAINSRLHAVLTTLYLLFNEGYYSASQNISLRKDLCLEAMRLNYLLLENEHTNTPEVNALMALMCFHSSRFDARVTENGDTILYAEQDEALWNGELIAKGEYYITEAAKVKTISKYHLEASIAYWHTRRADAGQKWENILQLYNKLLQLEYSPAAALNRTYALARTYGKQAAIAEAEKLKLYKSHLYYSLLAYLYTDLDNGKASENLHEALKLAKSDADKKIILKNLQQLNQT